MADLVSPMTTAWTTISEIVSAIFEIVVHHEDLWALAACARVSRQWHRIANIVALRTFSQLRSRMDFRKAGVFLEAVNACKEDPKPYTPQAPPFRSAMPLACYYNSLLRHQLIGRGSFSRVFHFGGLRSMCVKVASGGLTDKEERVGSFDEYEVNLILLGLEHRPALELVYITSGRAVHMISHRKVTFMLAYEFAGLQALARLPLPPNETSPLYPSPYYFGYVAQTSYYVMEELPGVTLRKVLCSAVREPSKLNSSTDLIEINFAPLFMRLLRYMHFLREAYEIYHGDFKPENIILVREGDGWRLRLIDPIPHARGCSFESVFTLAYNPALCLNWTSDFCALVLVLHEVQSGLRPFDSFVEVHEYGGEINGRKWFDDFNGALSRLFGEQCSHQWLIETVSHRSDEYEGQFTRLASLLDTSNALRIFVAKAALPVQE